MNHAVKIISETADVAVIRGRAFTFGGKDLTGESFSKDTDLWTDRLSQNMPLLYSHGRDETIGKDVLGRVISTDVDDEAVWADSQIDKSKKYAETVLKLVRAGKLGYSSGAISHLVEVAKGGEIKAWPWVELSLTPEPAEPRNLGIVEIKDLPIELPDDLPEPEPEHRSVSFHEAAVLNRAAIDATLTAKAAPGSYEATQMAIHAALNERLRIDPFADLHRWASIEATYPDHVIASVYDDGERSYFYIDYTIDESGAVTLGPSVEMVQVYVPAGGGETFSARSLTVSYRATELAEEAKALVERRTTGGRRRAKEGRILSDRNRTALQRAMEAMQNAADEVKNLLAATEPQPEAKATDVELLALQQQIELLKLFVENAAA